MSKNNLNAYTKRLKKIKEKQSYLDERNKLTFGTYTKRLVAIIIAFCLINVEFSYILAFLGKDPLTDVTNQLIVTILGTVVVYIIRAFFDTWSENKYGDARKLVDELDNKINELESNTINNNSFGDYETVFLNCNNESNENEESNTNNDDQYGN